MSVTGNAGIGMPIILLHDAEGGIVTVELKNGEVCRGMLDEAEDSMNLVLKVLPVAVYNNNNITNKPINSNQMRRYCCNSIQIYPEACSRVFNSCISVVCLCYSIAIGL